MAEFQDQQEETEITYKELMEQLTGPFVDEGFPPDQRSILTRESVFELKSDEIKVFEGLEYASLKDIHKGGRYKLFDKIDPSSIRQGCI